MSNSVTDWIRELEVREFIQVLVDGKYYELLFPFLLIYAPLFTVLCKVNIFRNKNDKPIKSVVSIVSILISFYAVSFETSPGYTVGKYLMMLFPNISVLTMGILALYIIGAMLGKDFFNGILRKDQTAYIYFGVGAIGLGSVIYYMGIVMGFWEQYPITNESYWNMIIAIGLLVLGIIFLFIDLIPIGIVLLTVFGIFVYNYGEEGSILEYFVDPVIFIMLIIVCLLAWMNTDTDKDEKMRRRMESSKLSKENYLKELGGNKPNDYENRIYDVISHHADASERKYNERHQK